MYNSRYPKENLEKVSKQWWIMKKLAKKNDQTQQKNGSMQEEMAIMSPHDIKVKINFKTINFKFLTEFFVVHYSLCV